jgi:ribosomally synthesized peptide (two-chain TOMM family)
MAQQGSSTGDWQTVWIKAVARAWRDPVFEKELIADPKGTLAKHFQFVVSPGIDLKVAPASTPGVDYTDPASLQIPQASITLGLPAKPADVNDHAVALSDLTSWYGHADNCGQPCI